MSAAAVKIIQTTTPTTIASIYSNTTYTRIIKEIYICNVGGTKGLFSLALVPNSEIISDKHYLFKNVSIAADETKIFQLSLVISDNEKLFASSTSLCSVNIFGVTLS